MSEHLAVPCRRPGLALRTERAARPGEPARRPGGPSIHRDGSEVALRIFSDSAVSRSRDSRDKLEQEVATLQLITHPALVPIACAEFHEGERPSFLATPFIPGASLMRRLAAQGPFTATDALQLLEPVLDVVALLHGRWIVHEIFALATSSSTPAVRRT